MLNKPSLAELLDSGSRRIHMIGLCGSGVSGLARLLLAQGHRISGSDLLAQSEAEKILPAGITYFTGHAGHHVEGAELVVYSSAIAPENPERQTAELHHILCVRRAECLAVLSQRKETIVVCGSHGKTTAASMLTQVLRCAGKNPSHYIGAQVPLLGTGAAWTDGSPFVVEADESDGTLALFAPRRSLILNIEEEHLDYFRDLAEIIQVFAQLADRTEEAIVYCADDKNSVLLCSHRPRSTSYGFSELAVYRGLDVRLEKFSSRFTVARNGVLLGEVTLKIPGVQNVSNALGVIALAGEMGLAWPQVVTALHEFRGASRRFEVRYQSADYMIVDDYAHHPTEIRATLAAARNSGWKRVVAVFQPHRYSRTKALLEEFAAAFQDADAVFLTKIYAAHEAALSGITGEKVAELIQARGQEMVFHEATLGKLRSAITALLQPGDLVITLGAGSIHRVATLLAQGLKWSAELRPLLKSESVLRRDEPLSKHTTLRIGGPAQLWLEPTDEEDLAVALRFAREKNIPVTVIGRGSNLLVRDGGIAGLCLHLGQPFFQKVAVEGLRVTAGAGARLKNIVAEARKKAVGGLEFLEGIPGNLGGALRMNAGAMKGWTMDVVESLRCMDLAGQVTQKQPEELEIGYRSVPFLQDHIALSATLKGVAAAQEEIVGRLKTYSSRRWTSQPAAPSAGCIFKNPGPAPAGKLIDESGLKNLSVGPARVSEVHGNFIVNDGGASALDVMQLISLVQKRIRETHDIELQTEVVVLGEDS